MKVAFVASPVCSLTSYEVLAEMMDAWASLRPQDELHALSISEGMAEELGSGVEALFSDLAPRDAHLLGSGSFRRVSWANESHLLVDYSAFSGSMREGYSTEIIAEDICNAGAGKKSIDLLVPPLALWSDGGVDLLARLAQGSAAAPESGLAHRGITSDLSWVAGAVTRARQVLRSTRVRVLVSSQQPFLGFSGVARRSRSTLGDERAQEREQAFSAFAYERARLARESLLHAANEHHPHVHYEGCGSGAAGVLESLGAQILPLDMLITSHVGDAVASSDLVIYITPRVEENLPPGLLALAQLCESNAHPLVLIYGKGALRRGEFPELGLSGAYELTSAYKRESDDVSLRQLLRKRGLTLATTWGW